LSNPAGLAFLSNDGFHMSLSIQSAFQTRDIDASCEGLGLNKYYEGKASAPVIPSLFAAYKKGDWTISGFFGITGGGGKASFDDGLPMFDAMVIGGLGAQKIPSNAYSLKSYMDGKQYIYSVQLGLTYKITEWFSAFAGGRMNYFTGGYQGALKASAAVDLPSPAGTIPVGTELIGIDLDCDQTGWGFTPVIGLDAKWGKLNIGAKYEFMTNLNIENSTKANSLRMIGAAESELADYKHGVNTPNDIPSMLSIAASYEFLPVLRASVEYHFFDDKSAGMAGGKQKYLTKGTNEYLAGIEWDVTKHLTLSCGGQITDYGLSDNYQSDTSFSCDSYTLGFGAKLNLTERAALNVGYMWTTYEDYTKKSQNYNNTGLSGTNIYSRTNKVFGASINYRF
jgi:long-chain fatty acid transport protein